jgi:hypothetical protein
MSAKKTVSFDAVISTCVGIQRDDTNPILSILDLDHDALNKFMRVSLSKIKGETTKNCCETTIISSYSTLNMIFFSQELTTQGWSITRLQNITRNGKQY